jgi:RNA polymerase sigma-32 factor
MAFRNTGQLSNYMSLASRYPILTWDEERELARRWREEGDASAAERLVLCNLRAVVKISGEFKNRHTHFEDLVQEGNVGLMRAIDHFDPERGTRFLSYAGWWIRACIKEYLLRSRSQVRLGTTQKQRAIYSRLGRAKRELERLYPDCDPAKRLTRLSRILEQDPKLVEQMESRLAGHDLSLHTKVDEGSDTMYVDLLSDTGPDTEEETGNRETDAFRTARLTEAMDCLTDKEHFIIRHRFLTGNTRTLRELGEELGISRERVRQLEVRAKKKLRKTLLAQPWAGELLDTVDLEAVRVA